MQVIANCSVKENFHPHDDSNSLFDEATHVVTDMKSLITVKDLKNDFM